MKKDLILKIFIFTFFIIISLFVLFFSFNFKNKSSYESLINNDYYSWLNLENILNSSNYKKIWIDPEKYINLYEFLSEFREYDWIDFDPVVENFVIAKKLDNWIIRYIPFRFLIDHQIFDDEVYKNLAILDIYESYKSNLIYWWYNSSSSHKIIFEQDLYHEYTQDLRDIFSVNLYDQWNNVYDYISNLEKSDENTNLEKELLAYLYDFTWEYEKAKNIRTDFNDNITLKIDWSVYDSDYNLIDWFNFHILNTWENISFSEWWIFEIERNFFPFSHLRFKVTKKWYSDWFVTISLNQLKSFSDYSKISINFILHEADDYFILNENSINDYKIAKYYLLENDKSKYYIPYDSLYYNDLEKSNTNDITVYLYQFNRNTNLENLLDNDTFEPVYWYVWNTMVTFWMPYIQIIDNISWRELFTKSSDPIILQNTIYHMNELYNNEDWLYWEVTTEDIEYLYNISQDLWWYPIDFDFIVNEGMLRWPARWTLNRTKWIWRSVPHRLIDLDWTVELPFYHID